MSEGWEYELAAVGNHVGLLAIQIVDPCDVELPNIGWRSFDQVVTLNTSDEETRATYRRKMAIRQHRLETVVREQGNGQLLQLKTDEVLDQQLKQVSKQSQAVLSRH